MTVEVAFACVIAFAVALVQASRKTILETGQILGPVQIVAAMVCAALVPTLSVYTLHFHTAWALGISEQSALVQAITLHGLELAFGTAATLLLASCAAYAISAKSLLAGRRIGELFPAVAAILLVLSVPLRGAVGGRFTGDDAPPTVIATAIVIIFLVAAILAASRLDSRLND